VFVAGVGGAEGVTRGAAQDAGFVRVVPGAFLGVGEDFVGGLDFGEEGGGALDVAIVAVGVEFEGFAAVGFFDSGRWWLKLRYVNCGGNRSVLVVGGCSLYAEELVVACFYLRANLGLRRPAGRLGGAH